MTRVFVCERRKFATLEAAREYAAKYFARWRVVVAITERVSR